MVFFITSAECSGSHIYLHGLDESGDARILGFPIEPNPVFVEDPDGEELKEIYGESHRVRRVDFEDAESRKKFVKENPTCWNASDRWEFAFLVKHKILCGSWYQFGGNFRKTPIPSTNNFYFFDFPAFSAERVERPPPRPRIAEIYVREIHSTFSPVFDSSLAHTQIASIVLGIGRLGEKRTWIQFGLRTAECEKVADFLCTYDSETVLLREFYFVLMSFKISGIAVENKYALWQIQHRAAQLSAFPPTGFDYFPRTPYLLKTPVEFQKLSMSRIFLDYSTVGDIHAGFLEESFCGLRTTFKREDCPSHAWFNAMFNGMHLREAPYAGNRGFHLALEHCQWFGKAETIQISPLPIEEYERAQLYADDPWLPVLEKGGYVWNIIPRHVREVFEVCDIRNHFLFPNNISRGRFHAWIVRNAQEISKTAEEYCWPVFFSTMYGPPVAPNFPQTPEFRAFYMYSMAHGTPLHVYKKPQIIKKRQHFKTFLNALDIRPGGYEAWEFLFNKFEKLHQVTQLVDILKLPFLFQDLSAAFQLSHSPFFSESLAGISQKAFQLRRRAYYLGWEIVKNTTEDGIIAVHSSGGYRTANQECPKFFNWYTNFHEYPIIIRRLLKEFENAMIEEFSWTDVCARVQERLNQEARLPDDALPFLLTLENEMTFKASVGKFKRLQLYSEHKRICQPTVAVSSVRKLGFYRYEDALRQRLMPEIDKLISIFLADFSVRLDLFSPSTENIQRNAGVFLDLLRNSLTSKVVVVRGKKNTVS